MAPKQVTVHDVEVCGCTAFLELSTMVAQSGRIAHRYGGLKSHVFPPCAEWTRELDRRLFEYSQRIASTVWCCAVSKSLEAGFGRWITRVHTASAASAADLHAFAVQLSNVAECLHLVRTQQDCYTDMVD